MAFSPTFCRLLSYPFRIAAGFVFLPKRAPWLDCYIQELTTFPHTRFKDQCDSTSMAFDWIKRSTHFSGAGWLEYYRRLAEVPAQRQMPSLIRLQAPPGISHVYTLSGKPVTIDADGTAQFSPEDARPLQDAGWQLVA